MEKSLEAINTAKEYIPKLLKGMETTSNLLRQENIIDGNNLLIQVIEGLDWIIQIMSKTEDLHENKVDTIAIKEIIEELIEGLRNKDYTLVSDVLEYELINKVKEWEEMLKVLK